MDTKSSNTTQKSCPYQIPAQLLNYDTSPYHLPILYVI